jgi:ATP-dependent Clp protease ATP-binding subunit ClpC
MRSFVGMFERYSEKARQTMADAKHEADRFGSSEVRTEHILLALLRDPNLVSSTMETVAVPEIQSAISAYIPQRKPNPLPHDLPLSTGGRAAVILAAEGAEKFGHKYVQNEHILLALVQSEGSFAAQLLKQKGISPEKLRLQIKTLPPA